MLSRMEQQRVKLLQLSRIPIFLYHLIGITSDKRKEHTMINPVFHGNFYLQQRQQTTSETIAWAMEFVSILYNHALPISTEIFPSAQRWEYTGQPLSNEMLEFFTRAYEQDGAISVNIGTKTFPLSLVFVHDTDSIARSIFLQESRQAFFTDESVKQSLDITPEMSGQYQFQQLISVIKLVCEYANPLFGYGHIGYLEEVDEYPLEDSFKKSLAQGLVPNLNLIADEHIFYYYSQVLLQSGSNAQLLNIEPRRLDTLPNGGALHFLPTELNSLP